MRIPPSFLLLLLAGCSAEVQLLDDENNLPSGTDPGDMCVLHEPGEPFTFVLRNGGAEDLSISYGFAQASPIDLLVDGERMGIAPGDATDCGITCRRAYEEGRNPGGCAFGGPGDGAVIPAGGEVRIAWNRLLWIQEPALPACTGLEYESTCSLGVPAPIEKITAGILEICLDDQPFAYCEAGTYERSFDVDLTRTEVVIEL